MPGHVFFMDCLQNQLREVYCFEFDASEYPTGKDWEGGNMTGGYGTTYWEQFKMAAGRVMALKLVIPMPIANSKFGTGVRFPSITIYKRPEDRPTLASNDFATFRGLQVTSKRNLGLGSIKLPNSVQPKVGGWGGQNDTKMFVPTIVVLKKP